MKKKIFALCLYFVLTSLISVFAANDVKISVEKVGGDYDYLFYALFFLLVAVLLFFALKTMISHFRLRKLHARKSVPENNHFVMDESNISGEASFGAPTDVAGVKADEKLRHLEKYLKEDERTVINILKMKQGSCSQSTLRVAGDFSKAKLSRLLMELEERGIIYKDSVGKKNIITLRDIN
jgi:uncharacterized membrane protein